MSDRPDPQFWQVRMSTDEVSQRIADIALTAQIWWQQFPRRISEDNPGYADADTVRRFIDDMRRRLDKLERDCA